MTDLITEIFNGSMHAQPSADVHKMNFSEVPRLSADVEPRLLSSNNETFEKLPRCSYRRPTALCGAKQRRIAIATLEILDSHIEFPPFMTDSLTDLRATQPLVLTNTGRG